MKGYIITFALTYGGVLASFFSPYVGLLIYVVFAIIKPVSLWHWSMPTDANNSRIVALGLLAGWMLRGFGSWQLGRARLIVLTLISFLVWMAVCANSAAADSSMAWNQVWELTKIVLPFLVGMTCIDTVRQVKQLAWLIASCQGYLAYHFHLDYYTSPNFDTTNWYFGGLDNNGIAITMVCSAGLTFFLGLYSSKLWQKLLGFVMSALMAHVVLFSMSRGGMLALILTGITAFALIPKKASYVLIMLLAVAVGARLAGPTVVERFNTIFEGKVKGEDDTSAKSRLELWEACFNVMLNHPVTGLGSNNWRLVAHEHGFNKGKDAHSMWMIVGAEMGFPGLALLLAFYGTCVRRLWRLKRDFPAHADPWLKHCPDMVIASIVGFAIAAQFVSVFGIELPFYVVLVGAAALKVAYLPPTEPAVEASPAEPEPQLAPAS